MVNAKGVNDSFFEGRNRVRERQEENKNMDIICAGEMLIDFTPGKEADTYTANPGGAPANVAISTARNGMETAFLGVLGNDDFGRRLKGVLEQDGVEMLCPQLTDEEVKTLAFVTLYEGG